LKAKVSLDVKDAQGNTALHYVAIAKNVDLCSQLILAGAKFDIENKKGNKCMDYFGLNEFFALKKKIHAYDVAICCAPEDLTFSKELMAQIETYHIVCALNENNTDPKAFISASRAIIFVLSGYSATTFDSIQNLHLAKDLRKNVYPIWKQKVTMSSVLESLIYRRQLVDFTDPAKFIDSTAQLVTGLKNIFEDKIQEKEDASTDDDSALVDTAFAAMVEHPNMKIPHNDLLFFKKDFLYLCHDAADQRKAALLASALCNHGFICCFYNEDPHIVGDLITNSWAFLLILSSRSATSSVTRDQIALAENRQKLILPVLVQKSKIAFDPSMTYTLARVAKFPFFVGDKDLEACVAKLVEAVRLAKQVSLKSEKLKKLREDVIAVKKEVEKSNSDLAVLRKNMSKKNSHW